MMDTNTLIEITTNGFFKQSRAALSLIAEIPVEPKQIKEKAPVKEPTVVYKTQMSFEFT